MDSALAYERHAEAFLALRDNSAVGSGVARRWAESLPPGTEVLEIACGGGRPVTEILIEAQLRIWAIDSSPTLLAEFRKRFPDIPTQCRAVLESDLFGRQFEAAITIGLIFLLPEDEQRRVLERVSGVLGDGGRFLFTAPVETGTWTDQVTGCRCSSLGAREYTRALEAAGFRLLGTHEDSGRNNYYEAEKVTAPESRAP